MMLTVFDTCTSKERTCLVTRPNAERALQLPVPHIVGLGSYCSVRQAAEYLGASLNKVRTLIYHYRREFEIDGMRKLSLTEIQKCETLPSHSVGSKTLVCADNGGSVIVGPWGLWVLSAQAVLRLALLLDTPEAHVIAHRLQNLETL